MGIAWGNAQAVHMSGNHGGGEAARGAVSLGQRARAELPRAHGNNAMPVGGHNQVFRRVRGFAHVP